MDDVSWTGFHQARFVGLSLQVKYVTVFECAAFGLMFLWAGWRAGMRERLRTSPVCDVEAVTRAVETAYRDAWRRWCAKFKIAVAPTRQSWTETGKAILP